LISEAAYERGVNLAASLAWHFSLQDAEVSFVVAGQGKKRGSARISGAAGGWLSRMTERGPGKTPGGGMMAEDALREMSLGNSGEYNIVLTARAPGSLPTSWWNCSYFVFLGHASKIKGC